MYHTALFPTIPTCIDYLSPLVLWLPIESAQTGAMTKEQREERIPPVPLLKGCYRLCCYRLLQAVFPEISAIVRRPPETLFVPRAPKTTCSPHCCRQRGGPEAPLLLASRYCIITYDSPTAIPLKMVSLIKIS